MYVPCQVGESLLHINQALMNITNLRWLEACSILYFEGPTGNFHQGGHKSYGSNYKHIFKSEEFK